MINCKLICSTETLAVDEKLVMLVIWKMKLRCLKGEETKAVEIANFAVTLLGQLKASNDRKSQSDTII